MADAAHYIRALAMGWVGSYTLASSREQRLLPCRLLYRNFLNEKSKKEKITSTRKRLTYRIQFTRARFVSAATHFSARAAHIAIGDRIPAHSHDTARSSRASTACLFHAKTNTCRVL